jgi:hypothetical protein
MKIVAAFLFALVLSISAHAQAAPVSAFSLTAQPVSLPGGKSTIVGMITGLTFTPTPNLDLREDNILAAGNNVQVFAGGFNYRLPVLSSKLNNVSPNLNGYRFQFYITASVGVDRITQVDGTTAQHYAVLAGGGLNYDVTGSGRWTFGGEVRYAKLPGFANSTAIVSVGPSLHF